VDKQSSTNKQIGALPKTKRRKHQQRTTCCRLTKPETEHIRWSSGPVILKKKVELLIVPFHVVEVIAQNETGNMKHFKGATVFCTLTFPRNFWGGLE
jgi:hypothetical protein